MVSVITELVSIDITLIFLSYFVFCFFFWVQNQMKIWFGRSRFNFKEKLWSNLAIGV